MQNLKEEFNEYSDILDTDFSDWNEDFFSENVGFSDVENKLQSQHLIKNLQSSNNKIDIHSGSSPIHREISSYRNVATSKWKEIRLSKLCTVNTSSNLILEEEQKTTDIFNRNKNSSCILKHPDEHSGHSEDFCTPYKKRKITKTQSVQIFVKPDDTFTQTDVPVNLVNNQIDTISVIEVPLEETSKSQSDMMLSQGSKMSISQETVDSQKEVKSADIQKMSSQEISLSQTSLSPTKITSSQESLGNKIMKICIQDNSISSAINQFGTHIDHTPPINSECKIHEEVKNSNLNQNFISQKLRVYHRKSLSNDAFSSKKMKADFPEKSKSAENFANSVSDVSSCIKSGSRYNNKQKRIMWNIRKKELEVTKRENALEIREKLLDAKEADIQKREEILKAKERKYLNKASIKNKLQKHGTKIKKLKKRMGVLEDDTNSFNTRTTKKFNLIHIK